MPFALKGIVHCVHCIYIPGYFNFRCRVKVHEGNVPVASHTSKTKLYCVVNPRCACICHVASLSIVLSLSFSVLYSPVVVSCAILVSACISTLPCTYKLHP